MFGESYRREYPKKDYDSEYDHGVVHLGRNIYSGTMWIGCRQERVLEGPRATAWSRITCPGCLEFLIQEAQVDLIKLRAKLADIKGEGK